MTEEKKTPKLEILDNVKYQVEFQFDKPKTGTHAEYGPWFAYRVKHEGVEKTLFATALLNAVLESAKVRKGTTAVISLNQEPEEKKKKYWLVSVNGEVFDSRNLKGAPVPPKKQEYHPENPVLITPSIDDLVSTYWMLFDKMEARFGFTKLGKFIHKEKSDIPFELLIPEIFKATTSVFIESRRNGLVVAEGSVRDAVPDKKGDPQDPFGDVPPPDDLPF